MKRVMFKYILVLSLCPLFAFAQNRPNILVVVADDMGVEAMSAYGIGTEQPNTPNLNALISQGVLFNNAWGYPTCSPSRSSILTGRLGNKNGVMSSGEHLVLSENTLFEQLASITNDDYADAAFGKWHLSNTPTHPNEQGADHFVGSMDSGGRINIR